MLWLSGWQVWWPGDWNLCPETRYCIWVVLQFSSVPSELCLENASNSNMISSCHILSISLLIDHPTIQCYVFRGTDVNVTSRHGCIWGSGGIGALICNLSTSWQLSSQHHSLERAPFQYLLNSMLGGLQRTVWMLWGRCKYIALARSGFSWWQMVVLLLRKLKQCYILK